jgi:hypothetical protein
MTPKRFFSLELGVYKISVKRCSYTPIYTLEVSLRNDCKHYTLSREAYVGKLDFGIYLESVENAQKSKIHFKGIYCGIVIGVKIKIDNIKLISNETPTKTHAEHRLPAR